MRKEKRLLKKVKDCNFLSRNLCESKTISLTIHPNVKNNIKPEEYEAVVVGVRLKHNLLPIINIKSLYLKKGQQDYLIVKTEDNKSFSIGEGTLVSDVIGNFFSFFLI